MTTLLSVFPLDCDFLPLDTLLVLLSSRSIGQVLHVGDTCTLFRMPTSMYAFGCTPLYTFVFVHVY